MVKSLFKPTYYINKIWNITPKSLGFLGVNTILADLDNTLVAWNQPKGDRNFFIWHQKLSHNGIKLIVVSNNSTRRVRKAVSNLGVQFESWSLKPLPFGVNRTLRDFHLSKKEVLMVGDQIMTDIIAANLTGLKSALVKPLLQSDSIITKFNRNLEKVLTKKNKIKWKNDLIDFSKNSENKY